MDNDLKVCKCGNTKCNGFILLHEKELNEIKQIKEHMREKYGNVYFDLKSSPSSGEIFTRFYDLHIINK